MLTKLSLYQKLVKVRKWIALAMCVVNKSRRNIFTWTFAALFRSKCLICLSIYIDLKSFLMRGSISILN